MTLWLLRLLLHIQYLVVIIRTITPVRCSFSMLGCSWFAIRSKGVCFAFVGGDYKSPGFNRSNLFLRRIANQPGRLAGLKTEPSLIVKNSLVFEAFALTGRQTCVHDYPGRCPGLGASALSGRVELIRSKGVYQSSKAALRNLRFTRSNSLESKINSSKVLTTFLKKLNFKSQPF